MAKRFTDTEKWKKSFFRGLQAPYKLVWLYLLDECNHAGVWDVEFDVLKIRTGIRCNEDEILKVFSGKIKSFDKKEKWFIEDFVSFQYGNLNPENRAHKSVIDLLSKYENKGLTRALQGTKDKDKDKVKDILSIKDENFAFFWTTYNKNIGEAECKLLYRGLHPTDKRKIADNVKDFIESKPDQQFKPDPINYLKKRMWLDDIIQPEISTKDDTERENWKAQLESELQMKEALKKLQ